MKIIHGLVLLGGTAALVAALPAHRDGDAQAAAVPATRATSVAADGATLTLATRPISTRVSQGDAYLAGLSGTASANGGAVYVRATDASGTFVLPGAVRLDKFGAFRITASLRTTLAPGTYTGQLVVTACADAACATPYAGATSSVAYTITVVPVADWETMQRDGAHDGYVPVTLDPSRYAKAWEWVRPSDGSSTNMALNPVVVSNGMVYASDDNYFSSPSAYGLRAGDGGLVWRRQFNNASSLSPPAVSGGSVYLTTSGHENAFLWALQPANGLTVYQSAFYTQWANLLSPTVRDGRVFINAGYYGGVVYAYDAASGAMSWQSSAGTYGLNTPAVDGQRIYVHNGTTLNVRNAATGQTVADIGPTAGGIQTDYYGMPMLGSADHVVAYNGDAFSGSASTSTEPYGGRQLYDYSVQSKAVRWISVATYTTFPATANGVVYAGSTEKGTFDALDEATGRVLWSWRPPETSPEFHRNVVVTDNVAFVSTATSLYAIDLSSHRVAWRVATPGAITLGADRTLYVVVSANVAVPYSGSTRSLSGKLVAYRLH